MIVWNGRGILIVLVLFACLFLGTEIFPKEMLDYAFVFAGLVSAISTRSPKFSDKFSV